MITLYGLIGLIVLAAMFITGVATILMRRLVVWALVGQIICLKAVAVGAYMFSFYFKSLAAPLLMLSLVSLALLPMVVGVGILVLHRCARFGGTLDIDQEDRLRN